MGIDKKIVVKIHKKMFDGDQMYSEEVRGFKLKSPVGLENFNFAVTECIVFGWTVTELSTGTSLLKQTTRDNAQKDLQMVVKQKGVRETKYAIIKMQNILINEGLIKKLEQ